MQNLPTYAFAAVLLAVAFATVLTAQSGGPRDHAQEQARQGALALGLRLAASPAR